MIQSNVVPPIFGFFWAIMGWNTNLSLEKGWKICLPNYYYVYAPSIFLGAFWHARISLDTNCNTNEWMARWRHFQSLARSSSNYESDYDFTFPSIISKDYISRFWVVRNQSQGSDNRKSSTRRSNFPGLSLNWTYLRPWGLKLNRQIGRSK